jgi:hypothetical protein
VSTNLDPPPIIIPNLRDRSGNSIRSSSGTSNNLKKVGAVCTTKSGLIQVKKTNITASDSLLVKRTRVAKA